MSFKQPFGVQPWSMLHPKPCYNKPCYKEVQVYLLTKSTSSRAVLLLKTHFWTTVMRWRKARVILGRVARKYPVKPLQPCRWQSNHSYIPQGFTLIFFLHHWIFFLHHWIFFASMPLVRFEPLRKRYVASHSESNRFTDWAIRLFAFFQVIFS